jgi:hypothetical protein
LTKDLEKAHPVHLIVPLENPLQGQRQKENAGTVNQNQHLYRRRTIDHEGEDGNGAKSEERKPEAQVHDLAHQPRGDARLPSDLASSIQTKALVDQESRAQRSRSREFQVSESGGTDYASEVYDRGEGQELAQDLRRGER